jgi:Saxitoxin biosynthesis operon protein SxtJ
MWNEIPDLDRKGLREFGLTTGGLFASLFGLFFPWMLGRPSPYWPLVLGGLLVLWALLAPTSLRQPYQLWMRFALLLSRLTTPVLMSLIFFLVITPTALLLRIVAYDPMARRFDPHAKSYRIAARKPSKTHMERPF